MSLCFGWVSGVLLEQLLSIPPRFCQHVCTIHPDTIQIPLVVTNVQGDELEMMKDTAVIWPWDFFAYLTESGNFLQWVSDDPSQASSRTTQYWTHCEGLDFFARLGLGPNEYSSCVPLFFHTDGVKIYKNPKAWVYSLSSTCRKGTSTTTKLAFLIIRENEIIKGKSHDAVGKLIGYMVDVMMTGCFPRLDHEGNKFPQGSQQSQRAGTPFASGWSMAFAGFNGDWEARVVVHKLTRYYRSTFICEHCMASYRPEFTFADFRTTANSQSKRFTHEEFLMLNPANDQSSWTHVRGWTKDRNLEDPCISNIPFSLFNPIRRYNNPHKNIWNWMVKLKVLMLFCLSLLPQIAFPIHGLIPTKR